MSNNRLLQKPYHPFSKNLYHMESALLINNYGKLFFLISIVYNKQRQ